MSWSSTMSRIRGKIQGLYYVDYEGIKYPVSKERLILGSGVDERVKGGKKTEYVYDHLRQFFRPGDTVLDVGAYIGTHSIPLALLGGLVHAFEPSPRNAPRLRACCGPLRQIQIHEVALSDHASYVRTQFPDCIGPECPEQYVRYVVYDDYAREARIPDPAFVKMDIEGMETVAFFGMTNLIEKVRPIWHVEYHPESRQWTQYCPGFLPPEKGGYNFDRLTDLGYVVISFSIGFKRVRKMTRQEPYYLIPEEKAEGLAL